MTDTHERPEQIEGYILSLRADGGRIRPFRRRADLTFARDQAPDFDHLQRHAIVTYRVGPVSSLDGRRHAIDVRWLTPHTPHILTDPALFGPAARTEESYAACRSAIQRRWEFGELSTQQRAALLIDAEFDRAHRLARLEPRAATPADTADDLAGADTPDHEQEGNVTDRQQGTVQRLSPQGYGFLGQPGSHAGVYFHARSVAADGGLRFDDLKVGLEVSYLLDRDGNGRLCAVDVRPRAESATLPPWPTAQGAAMDNIENDDDEGSVYEWGEAS